MGSHVRMNHRGMTRQSNVSAVNQRDQNKATENEWRQNATEKRMINKALQVTNQNKLK